MQSWRILGKPLVMQTQLSSTHRMSWPWGSRASKHDILSTAFWWDTCTGLHMLKARRKVAYHIVNQGRPQEHRWVEGTVAWNLEAGSSGACRLVAALQVWIQKRCGFQGSSSYEYSPLLRACQCEAKLFMWNEALEVQQFLQEAFLLGLGSWTKVLNAVRAHQNAVLATKASLATTGNHPCAGRPPHFLQHVAASLIIATAFLEDPYRSHCMPRLTLQAAHQPHGTKLGPQSGFKGR